MLIIQCSWKFRIASQEVDTDREDACLIDEFNVAKVMYAQESIWSETSIKASETDILNLTA